MGHRKFYCSSRVEFFRTANYGNEETFLGAFNYLIAEKDIIYDIGASIGIVSIYSAPYVKRVLAFEPDNEIFSKLERNIALNGYENIVHPYNFGISDSEDEVSLNSDGVDGYSPSLSNLNRHSKSKEIKVKSIDYLIEEMDFPLPTVLKIDIEGAEILALRGANNLLSSSDKPRLLFIEVHPTFLEDYGSSSEEIKELVLNYNYKIITFSKRDDQVHLTAIRND